MKSKVALRPEASVWKRILGVHTGGTLITWVLKVAGPCGPFSDSKLGQPPLAILLWGQQRQEA